MKFKLSLPANLRFLSFGATALFHGAIAGFALMPSSPTLINQQTIQVSFVAPSGSYKKNETPSHQKNVVDFTRKENAFKQKESKKADGEAEKKPDGEAEKKSLTTKETSGIQADQAIATKSAQSDPVFNAAYLNNPAPNYPPSAKRKGIQGKVLVSVVVKIDGTAAVAQIFHSSGSSDLDNAALEAVKEWKFIPARRSGQVVQASVLVPVEFKII